MFEEINFHFKSIQNFKKIKISRLFWEASVPTATHSLAESSVNFPPIQGKEIIVPPLDFHPEMHNDDNHYTRLMAGFLTNEDGTNRYGDPKREPLTFPDLFPNGQGHYISKYHDPDNGA